MLLHGRFWSSEALTFFAILLLCGLTMAELVLLSTMCLGYFFFDSGPFPTEISADFFDASPITGQTS